MKEELNKIIGDGIGKISYSKIAKVIWVSKANISHRLSWDTKITQNYYDRIMEAYNFIREVQDSIYKR